ncbi:hypothetical protein ABE073_04700 [Lederbergia citrisecunda]|uniref:hypothetical protein n=1 Tax=Lederbergia citrisecunda TaxID=2833583 RepID=UPI003D2A2861
MKTYDEIVKQEPVFLNDFDDKEDVLKQFSGERWSWDDEEESKFVEENNSCNIIFASYGNANYSGGAWVLFEKDGELHEVDGSHCSCYGLEGQWEPEEVSLDELEHRLLNGTFGEDNWSDNNFKEELCEFLGVEYKKNLERY